MTKSLLLFRHGKSDWNANFSTDWERPLAKRGKKAAKVMGKTLSRTAQVPDVILSSSAIRAKTTVELAAQAGAWNIPIQVTNALYEAEPLRVLALIHQQTDDCRTLMVVGHEPTCSELIAALIGGGQMAMPTGAIARIDFDVTTWPRVQFSLGTLIWLLHPKLCVSPES